MTDKELYCPRGIAEDIMEDFEESKTGENSLYNFYEKELEYERKLKSEIKRLRRGGGV